MSVPWPNHLLTLEEWDALPRDDGVRFELLEGLVVMTPMPVSPHQRAAMRLGYRLDDQIPGELTAITEVEVVVIETPPTARRPDVSVTRADAHHANPPRIRAAEVLLAVEILSDGTRKVDRILKFAEYAEAGILQYWMLDIDGPVTLATFVLVEGHYEQAGEYTGTATLDVAGHPVTLDLDALTRR